MLGTGLVMRPFVRPRWLVGTFVVLLVAVGCIELGLWQLRRLSERRAFNASVERAVSSDPTPLGDVLSAGAGDVRRLAYRRVTASGSYDADREVVLFGRTLDGQPGNEVLTPLVLRGGEAIIVDRGWIPLSLQTPPIAEARPPPGRVAVSGILWPAEAATDVDASTPPASQLAKVDLSRLRPQLPYTIPPVYLWLRSQRPASGPLPRAVPLPPLDEGPHLSYAVQWFIFAGVAVLGYGVLLRRDLARRRPAGSRRDEDTPEISTAGASRAQRSRGTTGAGAP